jgi:hypothetical protein
MWTHCAAADVIPRSLRLSSLKPPLVTGFKVAWLAAIPVTVNEPKSRPKVLAGAVCGP